MNDDVIALIKKYRKLTLKIDNTNIEIDNVFNKKSNKKENILFCFFVFSFYAYLLYNFNTIVELNIIQYFINNIQEIKYSIFAPNFLFDFLSNSFHLFVALVFACICSMLISLFFKTISFFIISLSSRKNIFDSFSERMQTIKFKNKRADKLNKLIDNISKEKRAIIEDLPLDFFNSINLESLNQLSITELKTFKEIFYDFKQINRNHFYKQYQEKDKNNNEKINKVFSQTELSILHKDLSSLNSGSTTTKIEQKNLKNKINIY